MTESSIDARALIKALGGTTKCHKLLTEQAGAVITIRGVEQWSMRGSIPFRWLGVLMALSAAPIDLRNFIKTPTQNEHTNETATS